MFAEVNYWLRRAAIEDPEDERLIKLAKQELKDIREIVYDLAVQLRFYEEDCSETSALIDRIMEHDPDAMREIIARRNLREREFEKEKTDESV